MREIAGISLDDGIEFDSERSVAEVIREEDEYSGIRVTLDGRLSRAAIRLHVDVNVGDPIWPEPQYVSLPRLRALKTAANLIKRKVLRWNMKGAAGLNKLESYMLADDEHRLEFSLLFSDWRSLLAP